MEDYFVAIRVLELVAFHVERLHHSKLCQGCEWHRKHDGHCLKEFLHFGRMFV